MVCCCAHLVVVLQRLVRSTGEVEVKPSHPSVVAAHNYVVARGVDVDAADPLAPAHQSLHQHLQKKTSTRIIADIAMLESCR